MPRVAAGADGRAVLVDHAAIDQMLGNELDGRRQPGEMGGQSLDQAIGLVEQADDRPVGLEADQLAHQAVLLGGQLEPEAAVDVLGGGPVADIVHGEPPWSMSGRTASGDLSHRRSAVDPTASTTEVRSIGKCYAPQPSPRGSAAMRDAESWGLDSLPYPSYTPHRVPSCRGGGGGGVDWSAICTRLRGD